MRQKQTSPPKPERSAPRVRRPRPPKRATHATEAFERIRADVITTALLPGERLKIGALRRAYAVGLSPLREALNRASQVGLVLQSDLRGFSVAPCSVSDLEQLTRARCWLAEVLLRESIARGDAAWEEEVLLAHHRLQRLPRQTEHQHGSHDYDPAWEAAHRAFHRSLVGACGASRLIEFDQQLFDAADRYRHLARRIAVSGTPARPDQHRPIMDAVLARDVPAAVELLQAHYERTAELGRAALLQMEGAGPAR